MNILSEERSKILIVEDEEVNITVLMNILNPHYQTAVALNGEQALKLLKKSTLPDIILLDVMMPGLDGFEVCRRIKNDPAVREIPVIFITGKIDELDEARGFQVGAVDYITKPFSPVIALARVKIHIELKRRGDMLEQLANIDALTGIPNRRQFDHVLNMEWKRFLRHRDNMSLILMDIDYFKRYNDHYGHTIGDECLKKVAGAISKTKPRTEDLAARYGGEEFACILPHTDESGALIVAGRIMESVRSLQIPHKSSKTADHVTISLGAATCVPTPDHQILDLVEAADKALYQAKKKGRDQIAIGSV